MKARLADVSRSINGKWRLTVETDNDIGSTWDELHEADVDITIKRWHEKRSRTANAYMWVLLDKLAAALDDEKENMYIRYIRRYGMFRDWTLPEEQVKAFCVAWEHLGTGWPTEQVDYAQDGNQIVIRAYYGSSTYSTKRFSRLLDAIVEDCREIGIETMPPDELAALLAARNIDTY